MALQAALTVRDGTRRGEESGEKREDEWWKAETERESGQVEAKRVGEREIDKRCLISLWIAPRVAWFYINDIIENAK